MLRVRQAIHLEKAAINAKEQEIQQLEKLRPVDKIPGEETPARKKPESLPLPIPSMTRIVKRRIPLTIILAILPLMERDIKETVEFTEREVYQ